MEVKRFLGLLSVAVLVCLEASPALAYSCPVQIKQAEELIARAEKGRATPETRGLLDEARKLLAEARAGHEGAKGKRDHADAIRKAKTAQALAEEVVALGAR